MPVHVYWGEDDFLLSKAVEALRAQHLDREWGLLNYIQ
ncbi:MAG: DNA polymerase III subunit delta, partial [Chroococcidiopsis sp.]